MRSENCNDLGLGSVFISGIKNEGLDFSSVGFLVKGMKLFIGCDFDVGFLLFTNAPRNESAEPDSDFFSIVGELNSGFEEGRCLSDWGFKTGGFVGKNPGF